MLPPSQLDAALHAPSSSSAAQQQSGPAVRLRPPHAAPLLRAASPLNAAQRQPGPAERPRPSRAAAAQRLRPPDAATLQRLWEHYEWQRSRTPAWLSLRLGDVRRYPRYDPAVLSDARVYRREWERFLLDTPLLARRYERAARRRSGLTVTDLRVLAAQARRSRPARCVYARLGEKPGCGTLHYIGASEHYVKRRVTRSYLVARAQARGYKISAVMPLFECSSRGQMYLREHYMNMMSEATLLPTGLNRRVLDMATSNGHGRVLTDETAERIYDDLYNTTAQHGRIQFGPFIARYGISRATLVDISRQRGTYAMAHLPPLEAAVAAYQARIAAALQRPPPDFKPLPRTAPREEEEDRTMAALQRPPPDFKPLPRTAPRKDEDRTMAALQMPPPGFKPLPRTAPRKEEDRTMAALQMPPPGFKPLPRTAPRKEEDRTTAALRRPPPSFKRAR